MGLRFLEKTAISRALAFKALLKRHERAIATAPKNIGEKARFVTGDEKKLARLQSAIQRRDASKNSIMPAWSDSKQARSAIGAPLMGSRGRTFLNSIKTGTAKAENAVPAKKTFLGLDKKHAIVGGLGAAAGIGGTHYVMKNSDNSYTNKGNRYGPY